MRGGRVVSADEAAELVVDPHDDADALERRHVVLTALRTLPYRQRQVLVLRYYLDLSEAQVAATLGVSRGAVHPHAVRGSAALARRLGDLAGPRSSEGAT
jgi:RNA polymerase sigma factor (sigma-70 family)